VRGNDPEHVLEDLLTMAHLHARRADRLSHDVEAILRRAATSTMIFVFRHANFFRQNADYGH
jgi:hypothetical protein